MEDKWYRKLDAKKKKNKNKYLCKMKKIYIVTKNYNKSIK